MFKHPRSTTRDRRDGTERRPSRPLYAARILQGLREGRTIVSGQPPSMGGAQVMLEDPGEGIVGDPVAPGTLVRVTAPGLSVPGVVRLRANGQQFLEEEIGPPARRSTLRHPARPAGCARCCAATGPSGQRLDAGRRCHPGDDSRHRSRLLHRLVRDHQPDPTEHRRPRTRQDVDATTHTLSGRRRGTRALCRGCCKKCQRATCFGELAFRRDRFASAARARPAERGTEGHLFARSAAHCRDDRSAAVARRRRASGGEAWR